MNIGFQKLTVIANKDNQVFTLPGKIIGYLRSDYNDNSGAEGMGLIKTNAYSSLDRTDGVYWKSIGGEDSSIMSAGNDTIFVKSIIINGNSIVISAGYINWKGYEQSSGSLWLVYLK